MQLTEGAGPSPAGTAPGKRALTEHLQPFPSTGRGGGAALPAPARTWLEAAFGFDLGAVRVHEDGLAESRGAEAIARGTDLHFARGRYDPSSAAGMALLGHELTHVVQQARGGGGGGDGDGGGGAVLDEPSLEREADVLGEAAAAGETVAVTGRASGAPLQGKVRVARAAAAYRDRVALLGDGSPANRGLTVAELTEYVAQQADWFAEPSLTAADREILWRVVYMVHWAPHYLAALGVFHVAEVGAVAPADRRKLARYATCFDTSAETVQMTAPAPTLARALQLGSAILELETFVPKPVLRVVIPEEGLAYLVDRGKLPELRRYYAMFRPTLESPDEWEHIKGVLVDTVGKYELLVGWVRDLHIFDADTRTRLVANLCDRSRLRPVLLIMFSASDWNSAFLQQANVRKAVLTPQNLAIVVQGPPTLAAAAAQVRRVGEEYGRISQVVFAGHGSDQSIEMASSGREPSADAQNRYVRYEAEAIDASQKERGTEALIDTVLAEMDPADASIVFAGCLVGSHDVPAETDVRDAATAPAHLRAALAANPNLADYVRRRMAAKGITGTVQAANGSTTFQTFKVDAYGRAVLQSTTDPAIAGSKLEYLRKGIEPEGTLRAALECYADPSIGPARTTAEMRARVSALTGRNDWWEAITRVGLSVSLPPAPSAVDVSKLLRVAHRVGTWFAAGWSNSIEVQLLADSVERDDAPAVFSAMLASSWAVHLHIPIGAREAWLKHDEFQAAMLLATLGASGYASNELRRLLAREILEPRLPALLRIGAAPAPGQMLLALTMAIDGGIGMPRQVRDFLRAAAGRRRTRAFPAALNVAPIIAPMSELTVLELIGLAPTSHPVGAEREDMAEPVTANVDSNDDRMNDLFITLSPRPATVLAGRFSIRVKPSVGAESIATVMEGDAVRVMGNTLAGWALIEHNGRRGFVEARHLTP